MRVSGRNLKIHTARARRLRRQATDAERCLWQHLRGRRLEGFKFRRQQVVGGFIVDFLCVEAKLIIEADGGQHSVQKIYDECRTAYLQRQGYRILRFWNHEILSNTEAVLERIRLALMKRGEDD